MENRPNGVNLGTVVAVRGSVVDIRFAIKLPPIYSLLHAQGGEIAIEVLEQLDAQSVRGIALTPTQGLARGMPVEDTGGPLAGTGGSGHSCALVRCLWQRHRPPSRADRCPMAHHPSRAAATSPPFHQIRNLRDGHQCHRCTGAAGANDAGRASHSPSGGKYPYGGEHAIRERRHAERSSSLSVHRNYSKRASAFQA